MKETLHIKNFGPIKDVKLELGKVNVLIGDQGTGKSTVAKLFTAIRNTIFMEIFDLNDDPEIDIETRKFLEYLTWFELSNYKMPDSEIVLESENYSFIFKENKVVKLIKSDNYLDSLLYGDFNFIPAERILISTLSDSLFGLIEIKAPIPRILLRFGNKFSKARKLGVKKYKELLGVDFIHTNGIDSIIIKENISLPLTDASSGIQGTIPLLIVFDSIVDTMYVRSDIIDVGPLLVIEEPELNLFPGTQKRILNYIIGENYGQEFHIDKNSHERYYLNQLLITTHSPYILTSLNNLMYAYTVGHIEGKKDDVNKIIEEKYWLDPKDVSAYMLVFDEKQGGCVQKNIIDKETMLIDSVQIDGVSDTLSEEFNQIMAIKLGV